jgi:superfamily II DNA or RNA helicase
MRHVSLDEIDLDSVEDAVGVAAYAAGFRDMLDGDVRRVEWDPSRRALHGVVQDRGGEFHETVVYFTGDMPMSFSRGYCSCPAGYECKHTAALTLAGVFASGRDPHARPPSVPWEQSLTSLLESRRPPGPRASLSPDAPVAVELALSGADRVHGPGQPPTARQLAVRARLVQPGANGGWVAGQLNWGSLDTPHRLGALPSSHLRLLRELYWTYQAGGRHPAHYAYRYPSGDRHIDLAGFESRQLWPLLDEAVSIGLPVVYPGKLGEVPKYGTAELLLDLTRGEPTGPLLISPLIGVDGTDAETWPIRFIGSEGHGLVYVDRAGAEEQPDPTRWRFRLARLITSVPAQLQQLALSRQQLKVPAAEEGRFRDQFYPRLRHAASVTSSDGSFALPDISPPTLVLGASYGDGHELEVRWEWAYRVGESRLRTPLDAGAWPSGYPGAGPAGYRDLEAEQAILAELDVPPDRIRPGRLTGLDTMKFSTELLPLLADRTGVQVEISGEPADYREAGDSLRIEVAADAVLGDNDWFDLAVVILVEGQPVPFAELFRALSRGDEYLLLGNGAYFSLDKPELQALAGLIEEARALQDLPAGSLRISRFQAGLWAELAELGVVTRQANAWQRQVEGLLSMCGIGVGAADAGADAADAGADAADAAETFDAADAVGGEAAGAGLPALGAAPPATLTAQLRPYQLDGFRWLAFLWQHQLGGILADDMGLGKTLQSLALISHARQADPASPPFLIAAPTSVVSNWAAEAARFTPDLKVAVITDTVARRKKELAEIVAGADAVVTTYTLLRIDFASYSAADWSGLILDEAQYAKNHQSKIYQCARRLPAPFKLAITGTPMENNLMELWSLLSITAPGLFPSPDRFHEYYSRPIERQGKPELLEQLRRRIKPLVKRRTKEQVAADLPAKQEQVLEVALHPRHRKLYQTHLQRERQKVLGLIDDMNSNRFTILRSLTLLRQLSLHAGLVDIEQDELPCSKLDALLDLLDDVIGGGHRALIFSQFTRFLEKVRQRLDEVEIPYCYLDGSTRDRAFVIQRFKDGQTPVFLISLKAGGFGLNLTEADYCFLLDPWWNPATEAQAVDRTHRIGQTRNVVVYRLISSGTIEEKVMALKARKAQLFSSVIDSGNVFGGGLDADDIRGLLE